MCTHQSHWRFGSWAAFWLLIDHHFCIRRTAHEVQTTTLLLLCCICCVLSRKTFSFFSAAAAVVAQWQTSSSVDSFFFLLLSSLYFTFFFPSSLWNIWKSSSAKRKLSISMRNSFWLIRVDDDASFTRLDRRTARRYRTWISRFRENRCKEKKSTDLDDSTQNCKLLDFALAYELQLISITWITLLALRVDDLTRGNVAFNWDLTKFLCFNFFFCKDYLNLFCSPDWNSIKTLQQAIFKICTAVD